MKNINPTEILSWSIEQLYKYIKTIEDELTKEEIEIIKEIEQGSTQIPVHINYYIKNYYQEFPSNKKAKIYGLGKIPIELFWKDIDDREKELRKIIFKYIEEEDTTEGRLL